MGIKARAGATSGADEYRTERSRGGGRWNGGWESVSGQGDGSSGLGGGGIGRGNICQILSPSRAWKLDMGLLGLLPAIAMLQIQVAPFDRWGFKTEEREQLLPYSKETYSLLKLSAGYSEGLCGPNEPMLDRIRSLATTLLHMLSADILLLFIIVKHTFKAM